MDKISQYQVSNLPEELSIMTGNTDLRLKTLEQTVNARIENTIQNVSSNVVEMTQYVDSNISVLTQYIDTNINNLNLDIAASIVNLNSSIEANVAVMNQGFEDRVGSITNDIMTRVDKIITDVGVRAVNVRTLTIVNDASPSVTLGTFNPLGPANGKIVIPKPTVINYETVTANVKMNGVQAVGSSTTVARGDHVHPVDASRAPVNHAVNTNTYGVGTSANYGHLKVGTQVGTPLGTSASGTSGNAADAAHVHPLPTPAQIGAPTVNNVYTKAEIDAMFGQLQVIINAIKGA